MDKRTFLLLVILLFLANITLLANAVNADSSHSKTVRINEIHVIGNKKTNENIILREVGLKEGETYQLQELEQVAEDGRKRVYNTNLFNEVEIQILETSESEVDLMIRVDERWYFYPSPIFRIADRNLMDWLINRSAELNRFNYGLKLDQYNFRGRKETFRFMGEIGFERRFILNYVIPYIEKTQRHGLIIDLAYLENEDIAYITENHLPTFFESDEINRKSFNSGISYSYRPSYYATHYAKIGFKTSVISDTLVSLNSNFLGNGRKNQQRFQLKYQFLYDQRDKRTYATDGHFLFLEIEKLGVGIFDDLDMLTLTGVVSKYHDLGRGFYLANSMVGLMSFPKQQPYFNYSGLGYDEIYARGFELDVIEGHRFVMFKNSFRKLLFNTSRDISDLVPIDQFDDAKLGMYAKLFFDAAWVDNYPQYEISSRLTNTFLYSVGIGLDMITMYDLVLRFEYSYNSADEFNFALNIKADM